MFFVGTVCACIMPRAAAVSAHPVRMRVVNAVSHEDDWISVALIPQVERNLEPLSKDKAWRLGGHLLQKTLHLILQRMLLASRNGVKLKMLDGSEEILSHRLLVYQCDYPEERAIMGLKGGKATISCTPCLALADKSSTSAGLGHAERPVVPTVNAQLKAATIVATSGRTETVRALGVVVLRRVPTNKGKSSFPSCAEPQV